MLGAGYKGATGGPEVKHQLAVSSASRRKERSTVLTVSPLGTTHRTDTGPEKMDRTMMTTARMEQKGLVKERKVRKENMGKVTRI